MLVVSAKCDICEFRENNTISYGKATAALIVAVGLVKKFTTSG
jgi:hypothetical protein